MADGGRIKGRRMLSAADREAAEWREFDHRQKLDAVTERVDADTSLVRLGPATRSEPGAGRAVRVTVPGRERVARTRTELVGVENNRAVYEATELLVPETREALEWHGQTDGRLSVLSDGWRKVVLLPRRWEPEDVLGMMRYAVDVEWARRFSDGSPRLKTSAVTQLMASVADVELSLVNARWVPTAGENSLADWINDNWLMWLTNRIERVAVGLHARSLRTPRGISLRKIGEACGFAPSDTNHTKSVIRKGLWRIGCKLEAMGPKGWPHIAEITFRLDGDH